VAHANLHLAQGLALGAVVGGVPLLRAWFGGRPVAGPILRMTALSAALAAWAVVPQLLTTLGAPARVHTAWWANAFLGHAAIDRREEGGLLVGEVVIVAYGCALYLLILIALYRARRRS
jgi:hypothetical protein